MPLDFPLLSEQSTCITISASFVTRSDVELTSIPVPGTSGRFSPTSSSSFTRAAVVSEATPLLDYARKLNISEEEAISSLGIVYRELNQDGTPTESQSSESVASINQGF